MKTLTLLKNSVISITFCIAFAGAGNFSFAQNCPVGNGFFELDGNAVAVTPNPPDDWDLIYNHTSSAQVTTGIVNDAPSKSDNAFTVGSKDQGDVSTWHWQSFSTPDKNDLLHAGAALYGGDRIYFFGDRYSTSGDAQIGFWFFKDSVAALANGTFSGHHIVGDILLLSDFVNGGGVSVIQAFEWVGSGGDNGSLNSINVTGTNLCAVTNATAQPSPWPYNPKSGPSNIFATGAFYEGGIVLSGLGTGIDPCFTSFLVETRSSSSVTAELKDFIAGSFFVKPQASVNSANICPGGTATLTATVLGGDPPFSYSWSNEATTSSITVSPTATTTYTVTVTSFIGCSANPASGTVTVNSVPACGIGTISPSNLICNHGNYTVSSSVTAASYLWSMSVDGNPPGWAIVGSNTGSSVTFSSGNCGSAGFLVRFTLTVTDANGCSSTCTKNFAPGAPACNVSIRPPVVLTCTLTSQYLLASYSTDIINPTFTWRRNGVSIGSGINNGTNLDSILISSPGTYSFTLVDPANSANTCTAQVVVTQNITPPGASATGGHLTCVVLSVQLGATSPTAGVTFAWTGPGGFTSSVQNPTVSVPGTYTVVVTNPANGCTSTAQAVVDQDITRPGASATGGTLTCVVTSVQLTASSPTASVTFAWTGPGGFTSSQQNPTVSTAGTYTVTVTASGNGCTSTAQAVVVLNNTPPNVTATGGDITCFDPTVQLTASSTTPNVTYSWTGPNGFTSTEQNPTVSDSGDYVVTVTDPTNGCTASASAHVSIVIPDLSGGCTDPITSGFELDGNAFAVAPNPPDDWDLIYNGTGHELFTSGIVTDAPSKTDNYFVVGTKDIGDIPTWHYNIQSVPDKDDILHAAVAQYNTQLFFMGDRFAVNGNAQIGFWFFKNRVELGPNGNFIGTHAIGDLLILSNFTNGGTVPDIFAYEWVGTGGSDGTLNKLSLTSANSFAIVNSTIQNSPWPYNPKSGASGKFPAGAFYEGGIDLACLEDIDPCFASFLMETRASASVTAELKDFVAGNIIVNPDFRRADIGSVPAISNSDVTVTAYPNPFKAQATIEFTLNNFSGNATVEVFDLSGSKVATLYNSDSKAGVTYKVTFDGQPYSTGIYFYKVTAADHSYYNKLVLIK